jgi:hypothetical protein
MNKNMRRLKNIIIEGRGPEYVKIFKAKKSDNIIFSEILHERNIKSQMETVKKKNLKTKVLIFLSY